VSHLLKSDGALIETADQSYETIAGKNYGGYAAGTSLGETANIQTVLEGLLQTYPTKSNNGKGLVITDQGGDDTFTGTQFDDLFLTSGGNDSLIGGEGTQDRVGLYWKPSSTAGTPTLQVEKSSVNKTITVSQKIGTANATELVKFTLVNTGADQTNPYWLAEHKNTGLALGWSDSSSGNDKLYGIEQAVFTCSARTDNEKEAACCHALCLLVQSNVHGGGRLCNLAGRDVVDTRHGDRMNGINTNATGCFDFGASVH
jgi:hypothetical protein